MKDFLRTLVIYSRLIIKGILFMAQFFSASLFFVSTTLMKISFIVGSAGLNDMIFPPAVRAFMISLVSLSSEAPMRTLVLPSSNDEEITEK